MPEGLDLSLPVSDIDNDETGSTFDLPGTVDRSCGMVHNDSNLSLTLQQNVLSQTSLTISGMNLDCTLKLHEVLIISLKTLKLCLRYFVNNGNHGRYSQ